MKLALAVAWCVAPVALLGALTLLLLEIPNFGLGG